MLTGNPLGIKQCYKISTVKMRKVSLSRTDYTNICWHREAIPQERYTIQQPTLLLAGDNFISATADFPNQMKSLVPLLEVKRFKAGHWIQLEKPNETNAALEAFFKAWESEWPTVLGHKRVSKELDVLIITLRTVKSCTYLDLWDPKYDKKNATTPARYIRTQGEETLRTRSRDWWLVPWIK